MYRRLALSSEGHVLR